MFWVKKTKQKNNNKKNKQLLNTPFIWNCDLKNTPFTFQRRQFACNVKAYFPKKINKDDQFVICWMCPKSGQGLTIYLPYTGHFLVTVSVCLSAVPLLSPLASDTHWYYVDDHSLWPTRLTLSVHGRLNVPHINDPLTDLSFPCYKGYL